MSRRIRHRLITALVVVTSLLFSQMALASYLCPGEADAESMAALMASGMPCQGMDTQQPVLCHQHSADPAKTFEAVKAPAVAQPAVVQVLVLPLLLQAPEARAVPLPASAEAHPPPDPLFGRKQSLARRGSPQTPCGRGTPDGDHSSHRRTPVPTAAG